MNLEILVITALILLVLSFIVVFVFSFIKNNKKNKLKKICDITKCMLDVTKADRIVVVRTTSGIKNPKPGEAFFFNLIHTETMTEDLTSIHKLNLLQTDGDYIMIRVEKIFVDLLLWLEKNEKFVLHTKDMPDNIVKQLYIADGIKYTEIYFIGKTKEEIFTCFIHSYDENNMFQEPNKRLAINTGIAEMKSFI